MENKSRDPVRGRMQGTKDPRGGRRTGVGWSQQCFCLHPSALHPIPSPEKCPLLDPNTRRNPGKTHRGNAFTHWVQLAEEAGRGLDSYVTEQMRP